MAERVEVERVSVVVDGTPLLRPTDLTAAAGEAVAVTGPNGAGKTTLLRVLAGLTRPSTGSARVGGRPVDERRAEFRRAVSGAVGHPPVARDLTLAEHLAVIAASWGSDADAARARAADHLESWRLAPLARRFPHELSSGQSQLAALAMATVRPYEVLLLDEPEQRLDPDRLQLVIGILRAELEAGRTLVLATHSPVLRDAVARRSVALVGDAA
ncbi:Nickel import ATP-binding protein NikO [Clavibacter michiganensis]|uniref:Nickel import ATP-binding protein NikO n=1 Tax=Clavibacter michiganensis TaxID=28447 RepID=A0A251Y1P3_9MICO|nr:ATP-binding cassette domain-containing protein [Clavibacter michiganensis]OUE18214.1 Nickel import ATP-binding protein NikO [Clavibacter michiganensis]